MLSATDQIYQQPTAAPPYSGLSHFYRGKSDHGTLHTLATIDESELSPDKPDSGTDYWATAADGLAASWGQRGRPPLNARAPMAVRSRAEHGAGVANGQLDNRQRPPLWADHR